MKLNHDATPSTSSPAVTFEGAWRVLVVEDHPLTRRGIVELVQQQPRFRVCGEAADAPSALQAAREQRPDIAIVDISLGEASGLDLTTELVALDSGIKVLVVSMHEEEVYAERALVAGARGYLTKREASDKIIEVLLFVADGGVHVSEHLKTRLLGQMARQGRDGSSGALIDRLSSREREVFQLIGAGYTTGGIAKKLSLSVKTIDSYREHLKTKLAIRTGAELVRYAVTWMRSERPSSESGGDTIAREDAASR